jgi:hypothetical protein
MMLPGSIKHPEGRKLIGKKVAPDLWVIENAYEGDYDYFAPSCIVNQKGKEDDKTYRKSSQRS